MAVFGARSGQRIVDPSRHGARDSGRRGHFFAKGVGVRGALGVELGLGKGVIVGEQSIAAW